MYIGSSKNISRRMGEYENRTIINKELKKEVNERNWEGFRVIVVLKEDNKEERIRKEYEIIGRVKELEGVGLYNVFIRGEDQEKYGEKIRLVRGRRVSDETRKRMIVPGSGERLKKYWFKGGVDNKNARMIKVIDTETGETKEMTRKEVIEEMGGTGYGVMKALSDGKKYKGRYELMDVEKVRRGKKARKMVKVIDTLKKEEYEIKLEEVKEKLGGSLSGAGESIINKGKYKKRYILSYVEESGLKRENLKGRSREVRIEDLQTGSIRVIEITKSPELTGGSYSGVEKAIRDGRIYKGRYIVSYSGEDETRLEKLREQFRAGLYTKRKYKEVRVEDTVTGLIKVIRQKDAPELTGGSADGVIDAIKRGDKYLGRYILSRVGEEREKT